LHTIYIQFCYMFARSDIYFRLHLLLIIITTTCILLYLHRTSAPIHLISVLGVLGTQETFCIVIAGLFERNRFDLLLPEFDKPWMIHLRKTYCCSTNLCTWRPNTVYKNRRVRRYHTHKICTHTPRQRGPRRHYTHSSSSSLLPYEATTQTHKLRANDSNFAIDSRRTNPHYRGRGHAETYEDPHQNLVRQDIAAPTQTNSYKGEPGKAGVIEYHRTYHLSLVIVRHWDLATATSTSQQQTSQGKPRDTPKKIRIPQPNPCL
jgi:hypothetical protein